MQVTREALVRAAMHAFAEEGLDAPSLDAICARAGFTRGAFYVHFQSRDELIVAVMERTRGRLMDTLIAHDHGALDLEHSIRLFAEAVASGAYPPKQGVVKLHHFLDACGRSKLIRARQSALIGEARRRLAEAARHAREAGRLRDDLDPDELATLLVTVVMGVDLMLEFGIPFDARRLGRAVLTLLAPRA
jgi:AcrR family transcriptional regulator